jgi:hypothetical protein
VVQSDGPDAELDLVRAGWGRGVAIHQRDLTVGEKLERADRGHGDGVLEGLLGCPVRLSRQGNPERVLTSRSDLARKTKKPVGTGPAGLLEEQVMLEHRKLLPRIVVKIGVKVKITIVRK